MAHAGGSGFSEWFWRILALAICIALAWLAWVAYQVTPRPVATRAALEAAAMARLGNIHQGTIRPAAEPPPVITLRLSETIGAPPPEK